MKYREAAVESVAWMEALTLLVSDETISEDVALELAGKAGEIARARYVGEDDRRLQQASLAIEANVANANATKQGYPNA